MFFLIAYDIEATKLRSKIARCLDKYGKRVQYSVFECELTPRQATKLRTQLEAILQKYRQPADPHTPLPQAQIRFYRLCETCIQRRSLLGDGHIQRDPAYYLVG